MTCWALLAAAMTAFVVRGPMRALVTGHMSNDLAPSYAATKAWLRGLDPYDREVLRDMLRAEGRELDADNEPIVSTSLYPPPTFVALAPLSMLSWPAARLAFLVVNLTLFAFHLGALLRLSRTSPRENAGLLLLAGVFALAPYHTGIATGQLAIPSATLLIIALGRVEAGAAVASGVALALAVLLKPQLSAPFLAYYLLRKNWRPALVATIICAAASVASIGWLQLHGVDWWGGWIRNTRLEWNGLGIDTRGPVAFHMVDARLVLTMLGIYPPEVPTLALVGLTAVPLYLWGRKNIQESLLVLAALAVWMLLVTYHRFYDAAILSLPFAWAVSALQLRDEGIAKAVLACCAVFLVPGQVILARLPEFFSQPEWVRAITSSSLALTHQAWTLTLLLVLLLARLRRVVPR